MPPPEIVSASPKSPRGRYASHLPIPRTFTAPARILTLSSTETATVLHPPPCSNPSSSSSSAGSSPSSVTTITTIESHSSSTAATPSRDLIAEYLAAKSRSQQAPAIFNPKLPQTGPHDERQQLELAYKHPILLIEEEDNVLFCSIFSSVSFEENREVEVRYIEDNSIELLEAKNEEMGEGEQESLIVPKPKMVAFHSSKASPAKILDDSDSKCHLVGRVNPNILKTWEQLSGGGSEKNYCKHKRKNSKNSLITVTSSENSGGDKQSCLIYYRNQYEMEPVEEANDFRVMKIRHRESETSESSTTVADEEQHDVGQSTVSLAPSTMTTTTTTTTDTTSSEGCYDFYDSIDDISNHRMLMSSGLDTNKDAEDEEEEEYALAAGEGLADFTSLDRKKLMWSIDVE